MIAAIALAAAAAALSGCKQEETTQAQPPRPVKTVVAQRSKPERPLVYSGVVRPRVESALGFRVSGKIVERLVNAGDAVAVGQTLARIDPVDLKLSEAAQLASVEAARTRLEVAKAALRRAERLLASGYVSQAAYDNAKLEVDSAQGALDSAQAQLLQTRNQVGYAELVASRAGVVTAVNAEPGQVVSAGQAVVTVAESDEIEVAFALPEHELNSLRPGQTATVALWADGGVRLQGRVREIAAAADNATRTYAVRVSLAAPPDAVRIGMTASVTFAVPAAPAIRVPLAALSERDGAAFVWVVDPATATVEPRRVETGALDGEGVLVTAGLAEGEIVVAAGVQFLVPGQKVLLESRQSDVARASAAALAE